MELVPHTETVFGRLLELGSSGPVHLTRVFTARFLSNLLGTSSFLCPGRYVVEAGTIVFPPGG